MGLKHSSGVFSDGRNKLRKPVIVAIDGPAGAGKSTIARSLARRLAFTYIDSGAMFRAVALWAMRAQVDLDDLHKLEQLAREARIEFEGDSRVLLNGEDVTAAIRDPEVSKAASKVSIAPGVRRALRDEQRRIGSLHSVVMEGRDIGTVVFPDADVKIYLDADPHIRAGRRAQEIGAAVNEIAREMHERDQRDRTRSEAPLTQAPDAEYIDSSGLSPEEVEEAILKVVRARTSNGKGH
jgi:CMP/dCMP kinase